MTVGTVRPMTDADARPDEPRDALAELRVLAEDLRAQVTANRVEVREALADHHNAAADRERAVAAALDSLAGQLNQFTGALAAELRRANEETVARASAELGDAARQLAGNRVDLLAEAIAGVEARIAQLGTTVGDQLRELAARPAGEGTVEVRDELAALRAWVETAVERAHDPATAMAAEALAARVAASVDGAAALQQRLADVIDSLRADVGSLSAAQQRAEVEVGDELARIGDTVRAALQADVAGLAETVRELSSRLEARGPGRDEPGAGLVPMERALNALDALDELRARPDPVPVLTRLAGLVEALAAEDAPPATREDVADVRRAIHAVATALADRPPATRGDLASLQDWLEQLLARGVEAVDVEPELRQLRAAVDELASRLAIGAGYDAEPSLRSSLDAIRAGVDQLVAWPAATGEEVDRLGARLSAFDQAIRVALDAAREPAPAPEPAPPPDLGPLVEEVAELRRAVRALAPVEDTLAGLRSDVAELTAALARLTAGAEAPPAAVALDPAVAEQLDAIGRLVHHAVRSLHAVEAATVGVGPRAERDREAAAAALDDLRAARATDPAGEQPARSGRPAAPRRP